MRELPQNTPSIAGRVSQRSTMPPRTPEPKILRKMHERLANRRLSHSATLGRIDASQRGAYRAPGSQKK